MHKKLGEVDDEFMDDDQYTRKQLREMAHSRAANYYEEKLVAPLQQLVGYSNRVTMRRTSLPPLGSKHKPGLATAGSGDLDKLLADTRDILTSEGLKMLLTIAQRVDADSKLQRSLDKGLEAFCMVQGWGMVPILPGISAVSISLAFKKVYLLISRLWNIPAEPLGIFERRSTRHKFYEACFDTSVAGWAGFKAGLLMNIGGAMTAGLTAEMLLTVVAGVALIHESLFWMHKEKDNMHLSEKHVLRALDKYRHSKSRRNAMARINLNSSILTGYSKEKCLDTLRAAIELGESQRYRQMLWEETLAGV